MCYSSAFTCPYDLLQFDFGQRNDSEGRSDEGGRERVVLAGGVEEVSKGDVDNQAEAEVDAREWVA
jgi:hypothetical protein